MMESTPQQLTDKARELQGRIAPQLDQARRNLTDFNSRAIAYINANPGVCLLGAVAVGFFIGRMASRR